MAEEGIETRSGISRRELVKRGAIVGGTLLWAAPVIQSVSVPAFGASPAAHTCCSCIQPNPAPGSINICVVDHFTCASCTTFCGFGANVFEFRKGTGCQCLPTGPKKVPRCFATAGNVCDPSPCP